VRLRSYCSIIAEIQVFEKNAENVETSFSPLNGTLHKTGEFGDKRVICPIEAPAVQSRNNCVKSTYILICLFLVPFQFRLNFILPSTI